MQLLLIEDNADLVENLVDHFDAGGHGVDIAYNGLSGLRLALENSYDAVVLDLTLPGMDGLEVCARLRAEQRDVPLLMLTARDALHDKLKGFDGGADDYVVKPCAMQELEARLRALVKRHRGVITSPRLTVQDLTYDPGCMRVERAGRRIELAPIPLRLLELLMRRSPAVVPRVELERVVWGDSPPDSDALRAHIYTLRSEIDADTDTPLLRTARGIGYQLAAPGDY